MYIYLSISLYAYRAPSPEAAGPSEASLPQSSMYGFYYRFDNLRFKHTQTYNALRGLSMFFCLCLEGPAGIGRYISDPAPGKSKPLPMKKRVPEQPSPWRKSCKRESCYGDRAYTTCTRAEAPLLRAMSKDIYIYIYI